MQPLPTPTPDLPVSTDATPVLAGVARLAAAAVGAPIALVVELGEGVARVAAACGLNADAEAALREVVGDTLFQQVFGYDHPLAVDDVKADARFLESPAGRAIGLAAYCGVPLTHADGSVAGTLCVADTQPRAWAPAQIDLLADLARLAVRELTPPPTPLHAVATLPSIPGEGLTGFIDNMPTWFTDHATVGFAALDPHGNCVWANRVLEAMLGQPASNLTGQKLGAQPVLMRGAAALDAAVAEIARSGAPQALELHLQEPGQGERADRFLATSLYPLEQGGALRGVGAFFTEISDRRRSERQLRLAEEKLVLACEAADVGLWFWDLHSQRIEWTERGKAIFGLGADAWIDYQTFLTLLHPDDVEATDDAVQASLKERGDYFCEYRVVLPGGAVRWVQARGRIFIDDNQQPVHMMGAVVDITATKEHEAMLQSKSDALVSLNDKLADLVETRTLELQRLTQHLIDLAEDEKAQLARELHDELGAHLTVVQMEVAAALRRLPDKDSPLAVHLARARETVLETTTIKRRIIEGLRPSLIESLGLAEAVRVLVQQHEQTGNLRFDVHLPDELMDLDPDLAIALYRIVQESLTNIAKYAEASEVRVRLEKVEGNIVLEVADNGRGLPEDYRSRATAHGISGMQQRAARFKGVFSIVNRTDGAGTRMTAMIPLQSSVV